MPKVTFLIDGAEQTVPVAMATASAGIVIGEGLPRRLLTPHQGQGARQVVGFDQHVPRLAAAGATVDHVVDVLRLGVADETAEVLACRLFSRMDCLHSGSRKSAMVRRTSRIQTRGHLGP